MQLAVHPPNVEFAPGAAVSTTVEPTGKNPVHAAVAPTLGSQSTTMTVGLAASKPCTRPVPKSTSDTLTAVTGGLPGSQPEQPENPALPMITLPSLAVPNAVMVALPPPAATETASPEEFTVTTLGSLETHFTKSVMSCEVALSRRGLVQLLRLG